MLYPPLKPSVPEAEPSSFSPNKANFASNASAFTLPQPTNSVSFLILVHRQWGQPGPHSSSVLPTPAASSAPHTLWAHIKAIATASQLVSASSPPSPASVLCTTVLNLPEGALTTLFSTQVSSSSPVAFLAKSMCLFLALKSLCDWKPPSLPFSPLCKQNALLVPNKPLY